MTIFDFNRTIFHSVIIAAGGHGILRSMHANPNLVGDIVPVDIVANLGGNSIGILDILEQVFSRIFENKI